VSDLRVYRFHYHHFLLFPIYQLLQFRNQLYIFFLCLPENTGRPESCSPSLVSLLLCDNRDPKPVIQWPSLVERRRRVSETTNRTKEKLFAQIHQKPVKSNHKKRKESIRTRENTGMDLLSSIEKLSKSIHQKPWYSTIDSIYEHSGCLSVELPLAEFKSYFADVYDYYIHNFFLLEEASKDAVLNKAEFVLVCCKMLQHRIHRLRQELSRTAREHDPDEVPCLPSMTGSTR